MKTAYISTIALAVFLSTVCGNSDKKDGKTTSEETKTENVKASENDIHLKQKGDYTRLYAESEDCKLTTAQIAEALGYNESKVEQDIFNNSCRYIVDHPSGFTVFYYLGNEKWSKNVVLDQIKSSLKDEMWDSKLSESGDTYIVRHPAQGYLLLLNPNYANPVRISYNYFNPNSPKLTDVQKEERKQNTYKIANYLIDTYKK
ncbi:hypothetical protein [Flavobacterium sp. CS20]|uniref:hypothetical protein n=1 Tax=Flavobacterium sp. CS20 TaxID=2775246 RepID=UPI001B39F36C|nr:hypothetical protein [Flavobacterium sp. CS20]QTY28204.1 hypothetical protein IGB25_06950 [Flavobacterium sp. CS20]